MICLFRIRRLTDAVSLLLKMIVSIDSRDLTDYTAVIPSVCVGNVGQLSADLLISTLNLTKIGYVWHSEILPFCGPDPYEQSNDIATACDIYASEELKLLVFQIRSAFRKPVKSFLGNVCEWLKNNKVKQIIVLAGISAHRRGDRQLIGEPLRYLFCPKTKATELDGAIKRQWTQLEIKDSSNKLPFMPGSGMAVKWFDKCIKEQIPCAVLFEFCSDGNNTPDAVKLADYLDDWLRLRSKINMDSWIIPPSWNLVFGTQPPTEIFN